MLIYAALKHVDAYICNNRYAVPFHTKLDYMLYWKGTWNRNPKAWDKEKDEELNSLTVLRPLAILYISPIYPERFLGIVVMKCLWERHLTIEETVSQSFGWNSRWVFLFILFHLYPAFLPINYPPFDSGNRQNCPENGHLDLAFQSNVVYFDHYIALIL